VRHASAQPGAPPPGHAHPRCLLGFALLPPWTLVPALKFRKTSARDSRHRDRIIAADAPRPNIYTLLICANGGGSSSYRTLA
jgi:hypothetical protein